MTYKDQTTKADKINFIRLKLGDDKGWAIKGMLTIYKYQTQEEQNIGCTRDNNGVGFSGVDSDILSSFAEQVKKGRTLSFKQMNIVFKMMPKYAKQLQRIVEKQQ